MSDNIATILIAVLVIDLVLVLAFLLVYLVRRGRQHSTGILSNQVSQESGSAVAEIPMIEKPEPDTLQTPFPLASIEKVQVQNTVQACTACLRSVLEGDYSARVAMDINLTLTLSDELNEMGYYLNSALDHLTQALSRAESARQESSGIQQSWAAYAQASETPTGFRYERDKGVAVDAQAWMPTMAEATQTRQPATQLGELAVPLALGNEVIGALGLQRDAGQPWTGEELLLIQDVVDQLSQTIDRLRLVDDVSRRAALEQTTGSVTASIRSEVEIEGVLQRALAELGQALQADVGTVYLTASPQQETT